MKKDLGIRLGKSFEFRGEIYKVFIFFIFILLGLRMAYLQIIKKDKYNYLAQ
ncbi:MAG: hypothetical protein ACRDB9_03400 [Cetobacterium sp.]